MLLLRPKMLYYLGIGRQVKPFLSLMLSHSNFNFIFYSLVLELINLDSQQKFHFLPKPKHPSLPPTKHLVLIPSINPQDKPSQSTLKSTNHTHLHRHHRKSFNARQSRYHQCKQPLLQLTISKSSHNHHHSKAQESIKIVEKSTKRKATHTIMHHHNN